MILDSPVIPSPKPSLDDSGVVLDMMMIDDSVKKEPQIRIANVTGVDDYLDDIYYHWKSLEVKKTNKFKGNFGLCRQLYELIQIT